MTSEYTSEYKRGPIANCIVFYDFKAEDVDLKGWFYHMVDWFERHGHPPTHVSLTGEGIKSRSKQTYKHCQKALEARDFKGMKSIFIDAYPLKFNDHNDHIFTSGIRLQTVGGRLGFLLCFDNDLVPFTRETLEKDIRDLISFISPRYGFCYQREFEKGPDWYFWGVIKGLDEDKFPEEAVEEERIAEWGRQYGHPQGRYHTGHLREIYPLNLLLEAHLTQKVGGQSLKTWIESSPQHGDLKPLSKDLWSWWIPQENISLVSEALRDTGIILCL